MRARLLSSIASDIAVVENSEIEAAIEHLRAENTSHDILSTLWGVRSLPNADINKVTDSMNGVYVSFKYGSLERERDGKHFTDVDER